MMMRNRHRHAFAGLALLILLATPVLAVAPRADTWVQVLPAEATYDVGQEIDAEVWIEDVEGLYGAEIHLAFDPDHLQVLDADPVRPGTQVSPSDDLLSPDFVVRNEADNAAGTVWYAVTQLNPSPPVTGSGTLFGLTFVTTSPGDTAVDVTDHVLSDRNAEVLPASTTGAVYHIGGVRRVFLPLIADNPAQQPAGLDQKKPAW
jgi:hypothetical protein